MKKITLKVILCLIFLLYMLRGEAQNVIPTYLVGFYGDDKEIYTNMDLISYDEGYHIETINGDIVESFYLRSENTYVNRLGIEYRLSITETMYLFTSTSSDDEVEVLIY